METERAGRGHSGVAPRDAKRGGRVVQVVDRKKLATLVLGSGQNSQDCSPQRESANKKQERRWKAEKGEKKDCDLLGISWDRKRGKGRKKPMGPPREGA